jgi:hypothetical protein
MSFFKNNSYNFIIDEGVLYYYNAIARKDKRVKRLILGKEMIIPVLAQHHDHPLAGHLGADKTYEKLANNFWFPDMYKKLKNIVKSA